MNVLFENRYIRDEEWAKDANRYALLCHPLVVTVYVLMALYVVAMICCSLLDGFIYWSSLLLPLLWCGLLAFGYYKNVSNTIRRDREMHGGTIGVCVTVFEDVIRQTNSTGAEYRLEYKDIKKAVKTEKYLYVQSRSNVLYSFKNDSFLKGNAEEFLEFLRTKGIKVKR